MSVILEKDKIIITIPSTTPESDLEDTQSDIILAIQNFDYEHQSHNFYQLLNLLEAIIPDRKTFEVKGEQKVFDMQPLQKLLGDLSPLDIALVLSAATKYVYKYGSLLLENAKPEDPELMSVGNSLNKLHEVFIAMARQADKALK
ncbi:hypothetical protein GXP67_21110 [Rhodocytophaga rosea]|uniref:Uncharacterized protein n=1 Tax=Rhodocytophaga rosea TaxID=2704465 RepID=A0A6C0GMV8_9BACT|nr:hypothetical protein [Rhodocytophaga rosea]QHT68970.1 hypothetical protein GXP67_21110 [Rhodocytophaga rosea]